MKKTVQAVKYALSALKVSPTYLFQLLESSKDYEGDNYERWLANEIIKIADSEGIPFTELLVKKLNILSALSKDADKGLSEDLLSFLNPYHIKENLFDFSGLGFGEDISDFDYTSGYSIHESTLGEYNSPNTFYLAHLDSATIGKKEVVHEASSWDLPIRTYGGALLFRLCLMSGYSSSKGNNYVFICDEDFFKKEPEITEHFTKHFELKEAYYLNKNEAIPSSFANGLSVVTVWGSLEDADNYEFDGIISATNFFTRENSKIFFATKDKLMSKYLSSSGIGKYSSVPFVSDALLDTDSTVNIKLAKYGYVSVNGNQKVHNFPILGASFFISIDDSNLEDVITYFACSQALEGTWGYGNGLGVLLNGLSNYESLVANCLPIFLLSPRNLYLTGYYSLNSEFVAGLYDKYAPFMSYESKVLWDLANKFFNQMKGTLEDDNEYSFYELKNIINNEKFNLALQKNMEVAMNYVAQQAKGFLC